MFLKRAFLCAILLVIFGLLGSGVYAQENGLASEESLEGRILEISREDEISRDGVAQIQQTLRVLITKGSLEGEQVEIVNGELLTAGYQRYEVGDKVVISYSKTPEGNDSFFITDYVRRDGMIILAIIFVILVVGVGYVGGLASLLGMAFSFMVIFKFILPQILDGKNAVLIAILGSAVIIPVSFILSHGISKKTFVAISGTIIALVVTGIMASVFVELTHLTGFAAEEAGFLQFELGEKINMKGILLAGIIIASLGVLDDITISQASVVEEISRANRKLKAYEVFARAMRVGRDHIASLVNTLVLVYTGASLPLLLLFINNPHPFLEVINYEIVADEIVRTLVGSIGLILAVPITTFIASYFAKLEVGNS